MSFYGIIIGYMNNAKIEQAEIQGVQVAKAGTEGPVIVYLHHAGQPPLGNANHILPLSQEGQVFAPNMYDLLAKSRRKGVKNPSFADMAYEFNNLDLLPQRARRHLVAVSWGGSFAWQDAADHNQQIASITAASPTGWPIKRPLLGWVGMLVIDTLQKVFMVPKGLKKGDAGLDLFKKQITRSGLGTVWYGLTIIRQADASDLLPQIEAPVELLWSKGDHYVPVSGGENMIRALPNARLNVVSKLNHGWFFFEPAKFINSAIANIKANR